MAFDQVGNFKKVTVSTGYGAGDTSIVLTTGHGVELPDPASGNYNLVWWDSTNYNDPADDPNVEIVRVTAKATDTLTVTRAQESTGASTKNTGGATYKMILAHTAKMVTDNTLQNTFDTGQSITIADSDNQTLAITNNDTTNNPETVTITNAGTNHGLRINQSGALAPGDYGLRLESSTAQASQLLSVYCSGAASSAHLAHFNQAATAAGVMLLQQGGNAPVLDVDNNGTDHGVYIHQDGVQASGKYGLLVWSNTAQVNAPLALIQQSSASSTTGALEVYQDGTGRGLYVQQDGVLASTQNALHVYSNAAQVNSVLTLIHSDNASSTYPVTKIQGDGAGTVLDVLKTVDANLGLSQHALIVTCASYNTAADTAAVKFTSTHANTSQPLLLLDHQGVGAHINFTGDPTPASPVDGDLWWNGTNLYFYDGASSTDLLAGGASFTVGTFTNASLSSGVLTITHSEGLTNFIKHVMISDNNEQLIQPDSVTFATNTIAVDLTSYGTLTGTWEYSYA